LRQDFSLNLAKSAILKRAENLKSPMTFNAQGQRRDARACIKRIREARPESQVLRSFSLKYRHLAAGTVFVKRDRGSVLGRA
jgi:hypothetical protein